MSDELIPDRPAFIEDETGKWADMIVLNHNLLEITATEIAKTKVQQTIFKGEVVYQPE